MTFKRKFRALTIAVTTALATAIVSSGAIAPVDAATKSTVTLLSTADITSLNSGTSEGNTSYNAVVGSLTGMGFYYYDSKANLVMNTKFGSMKIVKNTAKDFQIEYTVNKGQVWSDGTPIDAVDLLLTHVVASNQYSIDAGLGDPSDANIKPAFDSVSYSGTYGEHVVGLPKLSKGNMVLTVKFDQPLPDWELLAPGPSPVHALSLMADGKQGLQSVAVNKAAKAKFLQDFTKKNTARMKKMGEIFSVGYDVTSVDSKTNPLLLISNGGFIVSKFTFGDSMTLVRNDKYTSGPAMKTKNPIKTIVIKIIKDNTAAVQALRNGDIDVYYNTLPTANDRLALEAMPNVTVATKTGGNYSHLDLRVDAANGETDTYTGPFAGNGARAKDLRRAFLLAVPRQQMVDTLIKPVKADATTLDTQFAFQGTPEYDKIVGASGISEFTQGTQAERTAKALAIVNKYYPGASESNPLVKIKFVHANTSLRNALGKLIVAEAKKAGFDVTTFPKANLFDGSNKKAEYDVTMYGFGLTAISQSNSTAIYKSTGENNVWGWNNSALDEILKSLEGDILTAKQVTEKRMAADKIIVSNYWGLPLYANPTISAYNKALKGIDPAPIGANITWNFFDWSY
jgi:peptide/nickel transport system substrate-binding protein